MTSWPGSLDDRSERLRVLSEVAHEVVATATSLGDGIAITSSIGFWRSRVERRGG